jgi:hypothetical protein
LTTTEQPVERVHDLDSETFYRDFVSPGKPVVIEKLTADWRALSWSPDFFREIGQSTRLPIKQGNVAEGRQESVLLSDYVEALERHETRVRTGEPANRPGYLHDIPLFRLMPSLIADIAPFP